MSDESKRLAPARPLIILGDALHNFLDGAVIAIAFLTDTSLGIIAAIAVVAHELPQEMGDFGILLHGGMERKRVFQWNFLGALVSPIGAMVGFFAFETFENAESILLAFVVGNFIYIALADLVPTIQHERKLSQSLLHLLLLLLGIGVIWQLGIFLPEPTL